ncbi:MAG: lipoyl(octanoyl) transferase LipB [Myxococcales bacterium]|nr:lipoyl(octanoyl) transferase LipB [Myxococcales bacterium]
MRWCFLGRVPYAKALELQLALREAIASGRGEDTLLLLEHSPVITLGRAANEQNVIVDDATLARLGVERHEIGRGGDVTYHGPGQLVGYPVRYVGRAIREHVRVLSDELVAYVGELGIECWWRDDVPGVWTALGKIAAVGIDARRRVAMHGFALNLAPDLAHFDLIVPCGLQDAAVTSVAAIRGEAPTVEHAARALARRLAAAYGTQAREVSRAELSP